MLEAIEKLFASFCDSNDPFLPFRQKNWERLKQIGWPKHKEEAFQYVSLKEMQMPLPATRLTPPLLADAPHYRIAFIDGFFSKEHSLLPEGVVALPFSQAIRSYALFLQGHLLRLLKQEKDPFALLSGMFQGQGLFLYVPPRFHLDGSIAIEHHTTQPGMLNPRITLYMGRSSQLELFTKYESSSFCNSLFDAVLDEQAQLTLRDHFEQTDTIRFQSLRITQKRNSQLRLHLFSRGSSLDRTSLGVQLLEEGSEALLQGVANLSGQRQTHIHATLKHSARHTRSRQHFKNILYGDSRSSFEGKIVVDSIAQKTEAYQLNNNLLMSPSACAYAKPNLEIFADDVKASHGATITQLQDEDLFYLRSRGISQSEAKELLVEGFIQELAHCIPKRPS